MVKKFLEEVISIIVGKHGDGLIDLLDGNKYVNEFIIAKKMGLQINQVRNILYKISDYGLISSIRKKDKKKGWYTYFWKIEVLKCLEFLRADVLRKIEQIKNQIRSRESKRFYVCERCNIEFNEENAMLHDFTCVECGDVFAIKDNEKLLRELSKNLQKYEQKLKEVEGYIEIEREKAEKIKIKGILKEQKEKKAKRDEIREKRKKEELRLQKKSKSKKQNKKESKNKSSSKKKNLKKR